MTPEQRADEAHVRRLKWATAALAVFVALTYAAMWAVDTWTAAR